MKLLFLDFDGVLVNRQSLLINSGTQSCGDPPCVEQLNRILRATGAKIVVSSTWRMDGLTTCRSNLKAWGVEGEVVGITKDLTRSAHDPRGWTYVHRGWEIAEYLGRMPDVESFVIVDDDSDMAHLKHRLVQTHFEPGLSAEDADKAIAMLMVLVGPQDLPPSA